MKGRRKDSTAYMTPEIPLKLERMSRPSQKFVMMKQRSSLPHGPFVPVLPRFTWGALPRDHASDLQKLRAISSLEQCGVHRPSGTTPKGCAPNQRLMEVQAFFQRGTGAQDFLMFVASTAGSTLHLSNWGKPPDV